jgi:hypothetical protein
VLQLFAEECVDTAQPKVRGRFRKFNQIKFRTPLYFAEKPDPPAFT